MEHLRIISGHKFYKFGKRVIGMAVCDDVEYFREIACKISKDALEHIGESIDITGMMMEINDGI